MAYLTRPEFAEKCQIANKDLGNYIKRKKVILDHDMTDPDGNPMIDDSNPVNVKYYEGRMNMLAKKAGKLPEEKKPESKPEPEEKVELPKKNPKSKKKQLDETTTHVTEKDRVDLRKRKAEADLAEAKYKVMVGDLIPKELMKKIIIELGKSFITSYKDGAETLLQELTHRKKFSPEEKAQSRTVLVQLINDSQEKCVNTAQKKMDVLIKDWQKKNGYAGKRSKQG